MGLERVLRNGMALRSEVLQFCVSRKEMRISTTVFTFKTGNEQHDQDMNWDVCIPHRILWLADETTKLPIQKLALRFDSMRVIGVKTTTHFIHTPIDETPDHIHFGGIDGKKRIGCIGGKIHEIGRWENLPSIEWMEGKKRGTRIRCGKWLPNDRLARSRDGNWWKESGVKERRMKWGNGETWTWGK